MGAGPALRATARCSSGHEARFPLEIAGIWLYTQFPLSPKRALWLSETRPQSLKCLNTLIRSQPRLQVRLLRPCTPTLRDPVPEPTLWRREASGTLPVQLVYHARRAHLFFWRALAPPRQLVVKRTGPSDVYRDRSCVARATGNPDHTPLYEGFIERFQLAGIELQTCGYADLAQDRRNRPGQ